MFSAIDSRPFPVRLLAVALLGGGALLLIASSTPSPPPIYSMAALRAGLIRTPGAWVGRTVYVRALAGTPCLTWMDGPNQACIYGRPALLDPSAPSTATALPLRGAPQRPLPPLLAALRRLPLARWLAPAPQQIRWDAPTIYRVRLRTAPPAVCGAPRCYEALLLDATPGAL